MIYNFCPHCMKRMTMTSNRCPACGNNINIETNPGGLPIGSVLTSMNGTQYIIGKVLGSGGFGMTYIAARLDNGKVVAIKEYFPSRCSPTRLPDMSIVPEPKMTEIYNKGMQSFIGEASILRLINYIQRIVHVEDFFRANNTAYTVMEYLNGITLKDAVEKQHMRFSSEELMDKMIPLLYDIGLVHEAGLIHRDIAPDNIFLMPDGTLRLTDFGSARSMEDGRSMTVLYKSGFAPIEQYQTKGQVASTDVYSAAATIYYCLTGNIPPDAVKRMNNKMSENMTDPLIPISQYGVRIDPGIEGFLMKCLAIQPNDRPQTMKEVANGISTVYTTRWPIVSYPTGIPKPVRYEPRGQPEPDLKKTLIAVLWPVSILLTNLLTFLLVYFLR